MFAQALEIDSGFKERDQFVDSILARLDQYHSSSDAEKRAFLSDFFQMLQYVNAQVVLGPGLEESVSELKGKISDDFYESLLAFVMDNNGNVEAFIDASINRFNAHFPPIEDESLPLERRDGAYEEGEALFFLESEALLCKEAIANLAIMLMELKEMIDSSNEEDIHLKINTITTEINSTFKRLSDLNESISQLIANFTADPTKQIDNISVYYHKQKLENHYQNSPFLTEIKDSLISLTNEAGEIIVLYSESDSLSTLDKMKEKISSSEEYTDILTNFISYLEIYLPYKEAVRTKYSQKDDDLFSFEDIIVSIFTENDDFLDETKTTFVSKFLESFPILYPSFPIFSNFITSSEGLISTLDSFSDLDKLLANAQELFDTSISEFNNDEDIKNLLKLIEITQILDHLESFRISLSSFQSLITERKNQIEGEQATIETWENTCNEISKSLVDLSNNSSLTIDGHHNDLFDEKLVDYKKLMATLETIEKKLVTKGLLLETDKKQAALEKEGVTVFYAKARQEILFKTDVIENKNLSYNGNSWKIINDKILVKSGSLIQDYTGLSYVQGSDDNPNGHFIIKDEFGKEIDDTEFLSNKVFTRELLERNGLKEGLDTNFVLGLLDDYMKLTKEFSAREYLRISCGYMMKSILPGSANGVRKLPEGASEDDHPLPVMVPWIVNGGLKTNEFSGDYKETNGSLELERKSQLRQGYINGQEVDFGGESSYDAKTNPEIWRLLSDWAKGKIKLSDNGKEISPATIHTGDSPLISAVIEYLSKKYPNKKDNFNKMTVMRATRAWLVLWLHQSWLSYRSAEGPDIMYYLAQFFQRTVSYEKKKMAKWDPFLPIFLFAPVVNGKKVNVYKLFLDRANDQEVRFLKPLIASHDKLIERFKEEGLTNIPNAGFDKNGKEKKNGKIHDYSFLLEGVISMPDYSVDPDTILRFTVRPVDAHLFVEIEMQDGKRLNVQLPNQAQANRGGLPYTLFDYQDTTPGREGQIVYESFPFTEGHATDIFSAVQSLSANVQNFLYDRVFTAKDLMEDELSTPSKAADFKKNIGYILQHLPAEVGSFVCANMQDKKKGQVAAGWKDYMIEKIFLKCIFIAIFNKNRVSKVGVWGIQETENFLIMLVNSGQISQKASDALLLVTKSKWFDLATHGTSEKLFSQFEKVFAVT